jgi:hypothetical protein
MVVQPHIGGVHFTPPQPIQLLRLSVPVGLWSEQSAGASNQQGAEDPEQQQVWVGGMRGHGGKLTLLAGSSW